MSTHEITWKDSFISEMEVAHIIHKQSQHGVNFNSRNASWYAYTLSDLIVNVDIKLIPLLPLMVNVGTSYKKPFVLSGKFAKWPGLYCERVGLKRSEVGGPFTALWYTPFDPSKRDKVKEVMLEYGWIPDTWNTKKMPLDIWSIKKKLNRRSYSQWIQMLPQEEAEDYTKLAVGFIEKHFKNRSVPYMRAVVRAMGFNPEERPTLGTIKKKLFMNQHWVTSPKVDPDKDTWEHGESDIGLYLSKRMQYAHRRSLLQGLLRVVRPDGKIPAEANPCATPTARFKHRKVVNIPSGGSFFGPQCRSLFIGDHNLGSRPRVFTHKLDNNQRVKKYCNIIQEQEPKGETYKDTGIPYRDYLPANHDCFVGFDAAGLELRVLTHYLIQVCSDLLNKAVLDDKPQLVLRYSEALKSAYTYRETLLEGDIHTHNQNLAGLPTRGKAKNFIYGFNYGAGNAKLGQLVNGGAKEGKIMRERFLAECPCISVLIEWCQWHAGTHGWLPGLDGRKLIMRTDEFGNAQTHKALNTLLQAGGSIVVKKATIILDHKTLEENINCHQVIHMHDEAQFSSAYEETPALRSMMEDCVRLAGEFFNMECPLASDSMIGSSWKFTH